LLKAGDRLGISGPNASGKSSFIHALCGIIPCYTPASKQGNITFCGKPLQELPLCEIYHYMAVVLADASAQLMFPSCESEVAFALENMGMEPDEIRRRLDEAMALFKISHLKRQAPHLMSGGEQRLLLFAVAEAMQSPIVVLDEPERGLSLSSIRLLEAWLELISVRNGILIMSTHKRELMAMCEQRLELP